MAIYKFRISFEDYEDVSRDIEIKSSQTFYDFFQAILSSIGFDNKHAGSFFVSDDYWRKGDEITLLEDDVEAGVKLMKNVKIASCIERPDQHFVFLYDKEVRWSILIELIKLVPEDAKAEYPRCVKKNGTAPKQYKQKLLDKLRKEVEEGNEDDSHDKTLDEQAYRAIGNDADLMFDEDENHNLEDDENNVAGVENDEENESEDGEDSDEYGSEEFREDNED